MERKDSTLQLKCASEAVKLIKTYIDEINSYDNMDIFKLIACIEQGKLVWKDNILLDWVKSIVE